MAKKIELSTLRFGIYDETGAKSSIWKLWVSKNDVYFAVRPLSGLLKVSLHESGQWQCSFSSEYTAKLDVPNQARHLEKWNRPKEISPGITLAIKVIVPKSELRKQKEELKVSKEVNWIVYSTDKAAIEMTIFLSKPEAKISEWPGKKSMDTFLIDKFTLPNGETVWILYMYILLSNEYRQGLEKYRNDILLKGAEKIKNTKSPRAMLIGSEPDGSRKFVEVALD